MWLQFHLLLQCLSKGRCVKVKIYKATKKKPLFYGRDRPIFPIWQIFFFFFNFTKFCKKGRFLTKILKFYLKNVENKSEYFLKKFLQKSLIFFRKFHVFKVIFAPEIKKKLKKKKVPTNRPNLGGPSARKTGFFFSSPKIVWWEWY